MKIFIEREYKSGEVVQIADPHSDQSVSIELPQDYEANSWIEVSYSEDCAMIPVA
jgi:hypothetical protein